MKWTRLATAAAAVVGVVAAYDVTQKTHAILRNLPVIGGDDGRAASRAGDAADPVTGRLSPRGAA
jgi:hypothetical protein